jgi:type II secretory pathway pseudopilin PulG
MLEFFLLLVLILVVGLLALIGLSVFLAYVTQAQYVDERFDDNDD